MELIATVLKGETSQARFDDAKTMLDHGFAAYTLLSVAPAGPIPPLQVTLGSKSTVQPVLSGSGALLLEKEKAAAVTTHLTLPENVKAPVAEGDTLGELTAEYNGEILAQIPIVAGESVGKLTLWQLFLYMLQGSFPFEG